MSYLKPRVYEILLTEREKEERANSDITTRRITREEWAHYWPDEPYPEQFAPAVPRGKKKIFAVSRPEQRRKGGRKSGHKPIA